MDINAYNLFLNIGILHIHILGIHKYHFFQAEWSELTCYLVLINTNNDY